MLVRVFKVPYHSVWLLLAFIYLSTGCLSVKRLGHKEALLLSP